MSRVTALLLLVIAAAQSGALVCPMEPMGDAESQHQQHGTEHMAMDGDSTDQATPCHEDTSEDEPASCFVLMSCGAQASPSAALAAAQVYWQFVEAPGTALASAVTTPSHLEPPPPKRI